VTRLPIYQLFTMCSSPSFPLTLTLSLSLSLSLFLSLSLLYSLFSIFVGLECKREARLCSRPKIERDPRLLRCSGRCLRAPRKRRSSAGVRPGLSTAAVYCLYTSLPSRVSPIIPLLSQER
jgi:hypothetical protein